MVVVAKRREAPHAVKRPKTPLPDHHPRFIAARIALGGFYCLSFTRQLWRSEGFADFGGDASLIVGQRHETGGDRMTLLTHLVIWFSMASLWWGLDGMAKRLGLVVMTGGTSGVGLFAARRILNSCEMMVLGTRQSPALDGSMDVSADLTDLDKVRSFARKVEKLADGRGIDALILNAGGGFPDGRSADGFELNFAVNYLAHYLLLRLLMPLLSDGGTVILSTSGTHDPAEKTMIPPPVHADAFRLAHPDRDPERDPSPRKAAGQAYSASKLCNLLMARALAASPDGTQRHLRVIAFSPGPTPGTGLVRHRGAVLGFTWRYGGPLLRLLMPRLNSPREAGHALADLALGAASPPPGQVYALFDRGGLVYPTPSELARSDVAMEALWRDSAVLTGLAAAREGGG